MVVNGSSILVVAKELMCDLAISKKDNRWDEDVYLLYNPVGYGGVVTVGQEPVDMINQFDGKKTVDEVLEILNYDEEKKKEAMRVLDAMVKHYFLKSEVKVERKKSGKKLTCWLHITNDCNLDCTYCYIHKTHCEMSDEIIYKSIDMMLESCKKHEYETLSIMLIGGEPFTRLETMKNIISYCEENKGTINVTFMTVSNGTLITPEVAKYIAEKKITISVSLDGIKEYHDRTRVKVDGSGSYDLAMKGIENLLAEGIKPGILCTVTEQNLDGLPEFTKLMTNKNLFFRFSLERDTQTGAPNVLKNEEHTIEVFKECFKIMEEALKEGKIGWQFKFGDVKFDNAIPRCCAAANNFFSIGQDGSVGTCSIGLECTKTSIFEMTDFISDAKEVYSELGNYSSRDVEECSKCVWRNSCANACPHQTYATYKTFKHVSPYCSLYKACLPEVIRIWALTIYFNSRKEV